MARLRRGGDSTVALGLSGGSKADLLHVDGSGSAHLLADFTNPTRTGNGHHESRGSTWGPGSKSITLDVPRVPEDVTRPRP
ncbi:hypothetical protein FJV41_40620 [Myxococcus llanfairpwllgwyngyllgogerychwyrndrobwllllantysiliogogogochensis]|uniref:Uncharacterized protein n=1 Tax=Myxococcus llanfairpwllgwyngyllgogerychwyrndrobwllllantysiliogogogochensis TaxID=2590453 RepID=A0A540WMF0_9BACT|nr:hypothetical protein [Myxococcus llanfairpwllgwyngyllgogerychwyrndrobwllllantysiliogogogochensis]TQF10199.1 hypothetical protein FJV41_40620 [Myxococcus llanfairpwllgwyngyllgogerychwyrndrobwllllantysiliogogogochensis]